VQKRTYIKISEMLSYIGGYMQFMNTVFLLVSSLVNKIYSELKIINSIFNFNIRENKIILRLKTIIDSNKMNTSLNMNINKNLVCSFKSSLNKENPFENESKSKNNLILKDLDTPNVSSLNITTKNHRITEMQKISNNRNMNLYENSRNESVKSKNDKLKVEINTNSFSRDNLQRIFQQMSNNYNNYNNQIDKNKDIINIFDYLCPKKNAKKKKQIKLYHKGNIFYRKKMDIVHVFTLLSIVEDFIKAKYFNS
jgi:hypothetical protein